MSKSCFHCNETIDSNVDLSVTVEGEEKPVCCIGCKAVAETILAGGFAQYYKFRDNKAPEAVNSGQSDYRRYDEESIQAEFVTLSNNTQYAEADLAIEGIHCAACAWLIEQRLSTLSGTKQVKVNASSHRAHISWHTNQIKLSEIFAAIDEIGYRAFPFKVHEQESRFKQTQRGFLKRVAVSGIMTMQVMMLAFAMYSGVIEAEYEHFFRWISLILSLPVVAYSAFPLFKSAIRAILNRTVNMDVPVSLAIFGTFVASVFATLQQSGEVYFESVCMFTFLLLLGRMLEHNVRSAAATVTANMLKLIPLSADKREGKGYKEVSARNLAMGDEIRVKEGSTIPADGKLLTHSCYVDESMLTGESEPVQKNTGDVLYAGSIIHSQTVELSVTAAGNATTLYQMANAESHVQSQSNLVSMADKLSKYFVSIVLVFSAFTFTAWELFTEQSGFWPMIAVLVATCPCALSLAMPTAMVAAATKLKKQGILVNHSEALESFKKLDTLAFDKTGTLTHGQLSIESISCKHISKEVALEIIAAIESHSSHPIASAFSHISTHLIATDIEIKPGIGLSGQIDGKRYFVGNTDAMPDKITSEHQDARLYLADNEKILAAVYLADPIRDEAKSLLNHLPFKKVILSGDQQSIVDKVAAKLNISGKGQLKPLDKVAHIDAHQCEGNTIGMVGDGINDALVLEKADISIAVSNASDLSKQKSDIILLGGHLGKITDLFDMSNKLNTTIKQNLTWALSYNTLVLPLACLNILSPYAAVLGMSLSSLLVVVNSTKLLK